MRKKTAGNGLGPSIPILRMFDDAATREFYLDYLEYQVEWEHRFEPGMPLYMRIRRSESVLDLSEHHGDGTPGTVVWIPVHDIQAFHRRLHEIGHRAMRPGLDADAPGGPTVTVIDPSSNVLRFCEPEESKSYFG